MKRAVLTLSCLIAVLAPGAGAKGLIIVPPPLSQQEGDMFQLAALKTQLNRAGQREGVEYFVRSARDVPTRHVARGVFYNSGFPNFSNGDSTSVDWIWVVGFGNNRWPGYGATYDSLTMVGTAGQRTFTQKPVVFSSRMSGTKGWYGVGPVCSLGVYGAALTETDAGRDTLCRMYVPRTGLVWMSRGAGVQPATTMKAGQWRRELVCFRSVAVGQTLSLQNCDSLASRAENDTLAVWEYAVATPGTLIDGRTVAPILCLTEGTSGVSSGGDSGLMFGTLTRLDSLTLGKVFERRVAEPDGIGLPKQAAVLIMRGYANGAESFLGGGGSGGLRQSSLAIAKAQADSINLLRCNPTLAVEWDSLTTNAWQNAIWSRISDLRYCPGGEVGQAGRTNTGNCTATRIMDPLGVSRARFAFGDKSGTGKDTSVAINFINIKKLMTTRFGADRLESTAAFLNSAPALANAAMTADSLYSALVESGITTQVLLGFDGQTSLSAYGFGAAQLMNWSSTIQSRYGFNPDSAKAVRALSAYGGRTMRVILRGTTSTIGSDRWANGQSSIDVARNYGALGISLITIGRHHIHASVAAPIAGTLPANVIAVNSAGMGKADLGMSAAAASVCGQWTFRVLKQVDMVADWWNALSYKPNGPVFEWVYPSELR